MNDFSKKSDSYKKSEIMKMTMKIIERYDVLNYSLANKVAMRLYENGIKSDKFQKKYYKGKFDLDEIVLYLLKIQIREEKTVNYQEYINNKGKTQNSETPNDKQFNSKENEETKIIPYFPYKYDPRLRRNLTIDWRYYYNKNIK